MQFNSSFRFRTKKVVGSPNAVGCGQVTMASHQGDSNAHPQYLKKGETVGTFSIASHLASELDHAMRYARRMEIVEGKRDYLMNRYVSLVNDPNNYNALLEPRRHIITAYVLRHILEDMGLDEGVNIGDCISKDYIVTEEGYHPTQDQNKYVPSWAVFRILQRKVDADREEIENILGSDYLTKIDAANAYADLTHNHDARYAFKTHTHSWSEITGADVDAFATKNYIDNKFDEFLEGLEATVGSTCHSLLTKEGYVLTTDVKAVNDMEYYFFDGEVMQLRTLADDAVVPDGTYVRQMDVNARHAAEIDGKNGYILTKDVTPSGLKTYYKWSGKLRVMVPLTIASGSSIPAGTYERIDLDHNHEAMKLAGTPNVIGYQKTSDTSKQDGKNYYKYDTGTYSMVLSKDSAFVSGVSYYEKCATEHALESIKREAESILGEVFLSSTKSEVVEQSIITIDSSSAVSVCRGTSTGTTAIEETVPASISNAIGAKHIGFVANRTGTLTISGATHKASSNTNKETTVLEAYVGGSWFEIGCFYPCHITLDGAASDYQTSPISFQCHIEKDTIVRIRGGSDLDAYTWKSGFVRIIAKKSS